MTTRRAILIAAAGWLAMSSWAVAQTRPPVSYGRDIRPILSDKCFRCHGPDAATREADLRLDTREGITGKVIVPGNGDESELVRRIESPDDDERMPPPDSNLALSADQKALLRRWIAEGAKFSEHWAFEPVPESVPLPEVRDKAWPHEPLDNFVLARLEGEGLQPTGPASALRLLRRITLDLTGLPPTVEQCREFEAAAAADLKSAYATAVDRLLASSAYGEHMAVAWLDAARYADSYGYQSDQLNANWPYRDWVVRALNENLPYDQFLTQQLAGDLLPNATRDQILATAFNRLHRMTNEGGTIFEEARVEGVSDRLHTFGTAVLGLTLECARCHDHKYDPIPTRDYYSLSAFFNSIDENGMYDHPAKVPAPSLLLPTLEQEKQLAAAREGVANAEERLRKAQAEGRERFERWLSTPKPNNKVDQAAYYSFDGELAKLQNEAPGGKGAGTAAGLTSVAGVKGNALRFDGDHGAAFPGALAIDRWDPFTVDFSIRDNAANQQPVVVLQRTFGTDVGYNGFDEMLEGGFLEIRLYRIWPGNGIGIRSRAPLPRGEWRHVTATYDGSSAARGLRLYVDGKPVECEILRDHIYKRAAPQTYGAGEFTLGQRFRDRGFKGGDLDELRIFGRDLSPIEVRNLQDGSAIGGALAEKDAHRDELAAYYFSAIDEASRKAAADLREARRELVEAEESQQEISVMRETASPRATYVLARGAYDAAKSEANRVERGTFSQILNHFPDGAPRNRLGLAQWITEPRNSLTARVFVNRMWDNFFGRGLVTTPENFGQQGALPSHPELLNWLARDFVDHGWDIKRLCRMIVLSATYQQDSRADGERRARDPENALLARGPSRRLSAEAIRDVALAASGLLDRRMGGPPVSPYQPGQDLWREANTMSPAYHQSTGKDLHRRSLYSVWKRTAPLPNMLAFDAPSREVCTVSRGRTNTPLQALVLLNDVQFVEAARNLAARVSEGSSTLKEQMDLAFVRLTGRHADATELAVLKDIYDEQSLLFKDKALQDSAPFLEIGEARSAAKEPAHLAALTVVCQAILNLDATIIER